MSNRARGRGQVDHYEEQEDVEMGDANEDEETHDDDLEESDAGATQDEALLQKRKTRAGFRDLMGDVECQSLPSHASTSPGAGHTAESASGALPSVPVAQVASC